MFFINILNLKLYFINATVQILQKRINPVWNYHYNIVLINIFTNNYQIQQKSILNFSYFSLIIKTGICFV